MKFLFIILCSFPVLVFAKAQGLSHYVKMQEALAKDDLKSAMAEQKNVCAKDGSELKANYKDCGKSFKDIEEVRESFKKLSEFYIKYSDKKTLEGFIVAECPMAKAKWIQTKGGIKNPYYGKSMLECGQVI